MLDCHNICQVTTGRKYFIHYFKNETETERVSVLPLDLLNCTFLLRIRTAVHRPFLHIIIFIFLSSNTSTSIETTLFSPAAPLIFTLTLYKVPPLLSETLWKTFLVSLDGNFVLKTKPWLCFLDVAVMISLPLRPLKNSFSASQNLWSDLGDMWKICLREGCDMCLLFAVSVLPTTS